MSLNGDAKVPIIPGTEFEPLIVTKHYHNEVGDESCFVPEEGHDLHIFGVRIPQLLPKGGLASSGFNLASATLGAGTLALPSAMQSTGYVIGIIFLVICAASSLYGIRLLAQTAERTKLLSFEDMSREILGNKKYEYITQFVLVAFCWGCTVAYVVAIGDVLQPLQSVNGLPDVFKGIWGRRLMTVVFWGCFMLPLSLAKEINTLRYASAAGIISTCVLSMAVVYHAAKYGTGFREMAPAHFTLDMIMGLPIIMFSFTCATNAFEIYTELRPRTVPRMTLASGVCLFLCTSLYAVTGLAGYADFGNNTNGNILLNYHPLQHGILAAAFLCISVTLTMAFPICIFPTRDAFCHLFGFRDAYTTPTKVRLAICGTLATLSLICGLFTPSISVLFGVLGGACGSLIGFILPCLYSILSQRPFTPARVSWPTFLITYAILVFGIIAGVLGTIVSIVQLC